MQDQRLPQYIDIRQDANRRLNYQGVYLKSSFETLPDFVQEVVSDARVSWTSEFDLQNLAIIKGQAEIDVILTCMRCYDPAPTTITVDFAYTPVKEGASIDHLPEYLEPLEINERGEVDIFKAIEDDFIVSIPINPKHELDDCAYPEDGYHFGDDLSKVEVTETKKSPWDILKTLKNSDE